MRLPLSLVSPAGARGRLSILIFHRVLPKPDPLFPDVPDAHTFERHMRWVRHWFNVVPLRHAVDMLYAGVIPSRAMSITFDDGYADNEEVAAPILRGLGMSATFFISTGFLGGGCMWNDRVIEALRSCGGQHIDLRSAGLEVYPAATAQERRQAVDSVLKSIKHHEPERRQAVADAIVAATGGLPAPPLMMTREQVRSLASQGMDVGAHTVTHPILTRLAHAAACGEMRRSREELEDILRAPVPLFAYPNGVPGKDYSAEHVDMARQCGFSAAVSTAWGAASAQSDRFQLPRFTPWDRSRVRYGARLLANIGRRGHAVA